MSVIIVRFSLETAGQLCQTSFLDVCHSLFSYLQFRERILYRSILLWQEDVALRKSFRRIDSHNNLIYQEALLWTKFPCSSCCFVSLPLIEIWYLCVIIGSKILVQVLKLKKRWNCELARLCLSVSYAGVEQKYALTCFVHYFNFACNEHSQSSDNGEFWQ